MKILLLFTLLSFSTSIFSQQSKNYFANSNPIDFIVSKDGKKQGENVYRTIHEVNNALASLKKESVFPKSGINVWLEGGIYELDSTILINYNKDGNLGDITFRPKDNQKVVFIGGKMIPTSNVQNITKSMVGKFVNKEAAKKIKVIDLKVNGISDFGEVNITGFRRPYTNASLELFINGRSYSLSRFPNDSNIRIKNSDIIDPGYIKEFDFHHFIIKYDKNRTSKWKMSHDILISGNFNHGWATDQLRIKDIDKNGVITFKDPHMYGVTGRGEWNQYYFFNILEEIDVPGEYYVDKNQGKLYFYPYEDIQSTDTIILSTLEDALVTIKGAQNIHFDGINFDTGRGIGIYMENSYNCTIENALIRNMGVVGVVIGKGSVPGTKYVHPDEHKLYFPNEKLSERLGSLHELLYENPVFDREAGKNNGLINCKIENIGKGGVSIGGGNRLTLEPGGNYVFNSEFTNCGRLDYAYKAPVNLDGVGNIISHCQFNRSKSTTIYLHGNNHIIEYNYINEACYFVDDQGAIYIGRDPSEYGNIIRYNYFKNIGNIGFVMTIYYDDGACGTELYGNVFDKAGGCTVMIGGGRGNTVKNNIFIDNPLAIVIDNRLDGWAKNNIKPGEIFDIRLSKVNYKNPPYSTTYTLLSNYFTSSPHIPQNNDIENNVFVNVNKVLDGEESWGPFDKTSNLITNEDPGFYDYKNGNFELKDNSFVYKKLPNFKKIPFQSMGLIK